MRMAKFTRGWEFTGTNEPLRFVEKELKPLGEGYVRIKVHNAGLCSSDVGALRDPTWMALIDVPCILGHENAGEIIELGPNVEGWEIGERVAICPMPPTMESRSGMVGMAAMHNHLCTLNDAR